MGVTIQVFQRDTLPQAADAEPLLTHTCFYAMQVRTARPLIDVQFNAQPWLQVYEYPGLAVREQPCVLQLTKL